MAGIGAERLRRCWEGPGPRLEPGLGPRKGVMGSPGDGGGLVVGGTAATAGNSKPLSRLRTGMKTSSSAGAPSDRADRASSSRKGSSGPRLLLAGKFGNGEGDGNGNRSGDFVGLITDAFCRSPMMLLWSEDFCRSSSLCLAPGEGLAFCRGLSVLRCLERPRAVVRTRNIGLAVVVTVVVVVGVVVVDVMSRNGLLKCCNFGL
jgi:hypothetical protein